MPLALITVTRGRWCWLAQQAAALAQQLSPDDRWIIAVDNDDPDQRFTDRIRELIGDRLLVWLHFCYERPADEDSTRLTNAAAAFAPPEADIVEIGDWDIVRRDALAEVRHGFEANYDFIFGWHGMLALLESPNGDAILERRADYRPTYTAGGFSRGEYATGVRATRRSLWNQLGGWRQNAEPTGEADFARRAEADHSAILCVEKPLCDLIVPG